MPDLSQRFASRRAQFERDVAASPDTRAAFDACMRALGDVRRDYLSDSPGAQARVRLNELTAAAESGVQLMVAVSQVDIRLSLQNRLDAPRKRRAGAAFRTALAYVPACMCALLAAYLFLDGALPASVFALASGGISLVTLQRLRPPKRQALPDVTGETRVDPVELSRRMDALFSRMDELLSVEQAQGDSPLQLTTGLMESVQMLMEAKLQEDDQFALKALPQMLDALTGQGIEVEMFTAEHRSDFDLLPAYVGGETIRPAMKKDGRLLLRGQATIKG